MKVASIIAATIAFAISGCSTNIRSSYKMPTSPEVGLAVGSLTYSGTLGERVIAIEDIHSKKTFTFSAGTSTALLPFQKPSVDAGINEIGKLFAIELPAGSYKVVRWVIVQGYWTLRPVRDFSIPFSVKAGSSVYLGNYHIEQTEGSIFTTSKAELNIHNKAARDLPALRKRFPVLDTVPITESIAEDTRIEKLGGESRSTLMPITPVFVPLPR